MDVNFNYEPQKSHAGRAFLGFFLTFIMTICLIVSGLLISLKSSFFSGGSIDEILENTGFYTAVQDTVVNELYKNADSMNLSEDAIDKLFPEDTVAKLSGTITEAITSEQEVDLSVFKEDCMNVAQTTANEVVDIVFETYQNSDKAVDVATILANPEIAKLESDFGINVTDTLETTLVEEFGSSTIDFSTIDVDEVKNHVEENITTTVLPTIDSAFDEYIDNANSLVNESLDSLNNELSLNNVMTSVDNALSMISTAIIILIIVVFVLFGLQLLIYKTCLYRGIRNFSISALISGIPMLLIGMVVTFAKDVVLDSLDGFDSTEAVIKNFIENILSGVSSSFYLVGGILVVLFIGGMIGASFLKSKLLNTDTETSDSVVSE